LLPTRRAANSALFQSPIAPLTNEPVQTSRAALPIIARAAGCVSTPLATYNRPTALLRGILTATVDDAMIAA